MTEQKKEIKIRNFIVTIICVYLSVVSYLYIKLMEAPFMWPAILIFIAAAILFSPLLKKVNIWKRIGSFVGAVLVISEIMALVISKTFLYIMANYECIFIMSYMLICFLFFAIGLLIGIIGLIIGICEMPVVIVL